jgi:hypothetical protein
LTDNEFEDGAKARAAIGAGIRNMIIAPTDMMPTIITPMLENLTNHSFMNDRPLVSPTLLIKPGNMQFTKGGASEAAQYISNLAMDTFGYGMSPIKVDNVLRGTFGTAGQDAVFLTNFIVEGVTGVERPSAKLNQLPEIGAAFYDTQGGQRKNDYYDLRNQIMPMHQAVLDLRKEDPAKAMEYQQEHATELRYVPQLNSIQSLIDNNRKTKQRIMNSGLGGTEQRDALDALAARENAQIGTRIQDIKKAIAAEKD